jgi:hypothetical protein
MHEVEVEVEEGEVVEGGVEVDGKEEEEVGASELVSPCRLALPSPQSQLGDTSKEVGRFLRWSQP